MKAISQFFEYRSFVQFTEGRRLVFASTNEKRIEGRRMTTQREIDVVFCPQHIKNSPIFEKNDDGREKADCTN